MYQSIRRCILTLVLVLFATNTYAQLRPSTPKTLTVNNKTSQPFAFEMIKGDVALISLTSDEPIDFEVKSSEGPTRDAFAYEHGPNISRLVVLASHSGRHELEVRKRHEGESSATITLDGLVSAEQSPKEKITSLLRHWHSDLLPGGFVVVTKQGKVVFSGGFGTANVEHSVAIDSQTAFDVASVSKQFTGLAMAMLVQKGQFSLDDDARDLVPEISQFPERITLGHLVHHTSGIRDFHVAMWLGGWHDWDTPIDKNDILDFVSHQQNLNFAPGTEYAYSNTGYNVLAEAVARSADDPFANWCKHHLFEPLEMQSTMVVEEPNTLVPKRATGYSFREGALRNQHCLLAAPGSSSLMTTGEDIAKWMTNFDTAKVGGPDALELMQRTGKLQGGEDVNYGFGLQHIEYRGAKALLHGGRVFGFTTYFLRLPEHQFSVTVMSNQDNSQPIDSLVGFIPQVFLDEHLDDVAERRAPVESEPEQAHPSRVQSSNLKELVGVYTSRELESSYRVTIRDDTLVVESPHRHEMSLQQTGVDLFESETLGGISFRFLRDADERVNQVNISVGNRVQDLRFVRL